MRISRVPAVIAVILALSVPLLPAVTGPASAQQQPARQAARQQPAQQQLAQQQPAHQQTQQTQQPPRQIAPSGLFASTLQFSVSAVTPAVVSSGGGNTLSIRGSVENTAQAPVTGLIYRLQRGDALIGTKAVQQEIDSPGQPSAVIAGDWASFADRIEPGASAPFAVATAVAGNAAGSLQISRPGIYPLMVNVNGTTVDDGQQKEVRLGELHLLVTVTSVPGSRTRATGARAAVPFGLVWPLTSRPHRGVGGVFLNDSLAHDIAPGGVLADRLDALTGARLPDGVATLAIDPLLLDELDAMSRGYRVQKTGTVQGPITTVPTVPDGQGTAAPTTGATQDSAPGPSATTGTAPGTAHDPAPTDPARTDTAAATATTNSAAATPPAPDTVAGNGGAAATAFLDRLRAMVGTGQVLVLPYSNPDTAALVGVGSRFADLAKAGRVVAARVLGQRALIGDIALPPDAVTDPRTLDAYRSAGYHSVLLSADGVSGNTGAGAGLARTAAGRSLPALIDDSDLKTLLGQVIHPSDGTGAGALNAVVALLARRSFDGDDRTVLRMPDTVVSAAGLDDLGAALDVLATDGSVSPARLPSLIASVKTDPASRPVTVALPSTESAVLLDRSYLGRLIDQRAELSRLGKALPATLDPGAALLVTELTDALAPLGSAALRPDRSPGEAVLSTVDGTIAHLHAGVTIRPTVGSYTLASADSPLVLTVQNTLPFAVKVKVRIDGGDQVGLTTKPPEWVTLGAASTQQLRIPASVSRAGTFLVSAQLIGPDGQAWNLPVALKIRSNAYGTLTIILIAVAGAVLLLMVAWRIWQRWKARRERVAAEAARGPEPAAAPAAGSILDSASDPEEGDRS